MLFLWGKKCFNLKKVTLLLCDRTIFEQFMKFTVEEARKELSAKMTAKGEKLNLSERSLNEQLETLMPLLTNDETELTAFVEQVLPIFKTLDANVRNDVSVGIKNFKQAQPEPPQPQQPQDEGYSALVQRLSELEETIAKKEKENHILDIKKQLTNKLRALGVKDDEWTESMLAEISIADDTDVEKKAESLLNIYNKAISATPADITPGSASRKGAQSDIDDIVKEASALIGAQNLNA